MVIEEGNKLAPVEIKAGQTVSRDYFRGLERWQGLAKGVSGKAWLVYLILPHNFLLDTGSRFR